MKFVYALISATALSGCMQDTPWESSLVCAGPENTTTLSRQTQQVIAPSVTHHMPVEVRFRHGEIFVRSLTTSTQKDPEGTLHFQSQYAGGWMAGQYDASRQRLNLIIERHLQVDGEAQALRSVGTYECVPSTGPLIKGQDPNA